MLLDPQRCSILPAMRDWLGAYHPGDSVQMTPLSSNPASAYMWGRNGEGHQREGTEGINVRGGRNGEGHQREDTEGGGHHGTKKQRHTCEGRQVP